MSDKHLSVFEVLLNKTTRQTTTTGTQRLRRQSSCSELTARQQVKPVHQSLLHTSAHVHTYGSFPILTEGQTCRYTVHTHQAEMQPCLLTEPPPTKTNPSTVRSQHNQLTIDPEEAESTTAGREVGGSRRSLAENLWALTRHMTPPPLRRLSWWESSEMEPRR